MAALLPAELGAPDVAEDNEDSDEEGDEEIPITLESIPELGIEVTAKNKRKDAARNGIPGLDIEITAEDTPVDTAQACNEENGWNSTPVVNLKYSFKVNWPQRIPLRHVRRQFAELEQALQDAGVTFFTGVHVCFVASTIYIQSLITTLVFNIRTRSTSGP